MSLTQKLKDRVSSLRSSKVQTALESYREIVSRQNDAKPVDEGKLLELCETIGIEFERIDIHSDVLACLARLDETTKAIRKLASTEPAKRSQREAVKAEVERIIADAKQRLYEADIELESAFRAAKRTDEITTMRNHIASQFTWLLTGQGDDTPTADQARQIAERVDGLCNVETLTIKPSERLTCIPGEAGSGIQYLS